MKSYRLSLSGELSLQIRAADKGALPIVELLAQAMMLTPGGGGVFSLLVATEAGEEGVTIGHKEIICRFAPPRSHDDLVTKAMQASLALAHAVQKRGGLLVHGGLAGFQEQGVILAAPGGTGKTTAATRLPPPWQSLSDDAVLIVPDRKGGYSGHPWPTWSRFFDNGTGGVWDTAAGIPVAAACFLFQAPEDALDVLAPGQAAAMLIESVEQANRVFDYMLTPEAGQDNHRQQFDIVCTLSAQLPAYRLRLSLTGEFWKLIEETVSYPSVVAETAPATLYPPERKVAPHGVVFSGSSMYPTLREPDYLEVVPYGNTGPRRGDVVYFRAPESGVMVVHRVMAVRPEGISTMGDNNLSPDTNLVSFAAVAGRVVAARGRNRNSPVRGGAAGMLDFYFARAWRRYLILAGRCYRCLSRSYPLTGSLRYFTPSGIRFRFVFFGKLPHGHLKIMTNDTCVGHYSRGSWHIEYPWRLWVDPVKIATAAAKYETAKRRWREEITAAQHMPVGLISKGP